MCGLDTDGSELANANQAHDCQGIAQVAERFGRPVRAAIESCCGPADLAQELVSGAGWSVDRAHPGYVQRRKPNSDKTDGQDARLRADWERVGYRPRLWLAPRSICALRHLLRYRLPLTQQRRAAQLRRRAVLREQRCRAREGLKAWTKAWEPWVRDTAELSEPGRWLAQQHWRELARLATTIRKGEKRLQRLTATDVPVQRWQQQPGIGPVTAWTLRAEIGPLDRFRTGKQRARFGGLNPRHVSSGQRPADAGLIRAANPAWRTVLMEAAHRLVRYDSWWQQFAQRLRAAGQAGSVVAAAVANRWMRRLHQEMNPPGGEWAAAGGPAR